MSVNKLHNDLEMLLSLSNVNIDEHHMTGKQRVATAIFSQHHLEKLVPHCFLCFNYYLQYFVLCV